MIAKAFYRTLKAVDVGSVYPVERGSQLPAVVYNLISSPLTISVSGKPQMCNSRFQVDCYAKSYDDVKDMAQAIIRALHNSTQLDDVKVQRILLENQRDQDEQKANIYRQLLQFVIYHH